MRGDTSIDNTENVIDSRDVVARIEWLQGLEEPDEDEKDELVMLTVFRENTLPGDTWEDGATLIRYDYIELYCLEYAEEMGFINRGETWPFNCIDWKKAAKEFLQDYDEIDFNGVTYYVR